MAPSPNGQWTLDLLPVEKKKVDPWIKFGTSMAFLSNV